jgi:hypothetical protein
VSTITAIAARLTHNHAHESIEKSCSLFHNIEPKFSVDGPFE